MISTFQALLVALLALLPGASYTFAYERVVGGFGVSLSDRLVRFLAASAVFAAALSGPGLVAYRELVVTGRLGRGDLDVLPFWLAAVGYVVLPTAAGTFLGLGQRAGWRWVAFVVGRAPEPRAWDYVWRRRRLRALVRLRLKSGRWLGGVFANEGGRLSYAAGYPEEPDLYLSLQVQVDPGTGTFHRDQDGAVVPVPGRSGLLLRRAEIEYLDIQEF